MMSIFRIRFALFPMMTALLLLPFQGGRGETNAERPAPAQLARLVAGLPADQAATVSATLMSEAIRMGEAPQEVRRRVVITSVVLFAGVADAGPDVRAAVAVALVRAAGESHASLVAAAILFVADAMLPEAARQELAQAILDAVPPEGREAIGAAIDNPGRVLGLRLRWAARKHLDETLALLKPGTADERAAARLSVTLPSTTTTTTTTTTSTTTTTTRPSPTPVGRR